MEGIACVGSKKQYLCLRLSHEHAVLFTVASHFVVSYMGERDIFDVVQVGVEGIVCSRLTYGAQVSDVDSLADQRVEN